MPIKNATYTYAGINQDISKSKHLPNFYFEGQHIKILTTDTQSTGSVSNEKGNELVISIPDISIDTLTNIITYGDKELSYENSNEIDIQIQDSILNSTSNSQVIIGHSVTREDIVLFTTDNNMDCIWLLKNVLESEYDLELLYVRNLNFSTSNPIQAIYNYESDIIQKVYWVDGRNQLRFINLNHSIDNGDLESLINLNSTNLDITGQYDLSQPQIVQVTQGGNQTAGMIQYAYNLYKLNGSQTTISPLSELVPLDFGSSNGGGDVNEVVGASPLININGLDERYTHIRLYAIKYTSFNQEPQVSLIVDEEIDNYNVFSYFDDGNVINNISISEFVFLGSNVFIPKHIQTKDSRMFAASITEDGFDFELDCRAYGHNALGEASVWENVVVDPNTNIPNGNTTVLNTTTYLLNSRHDAINPDYDTYKYQRNGSTLGGEGLYIKYELNQKTISELENPDLRLNQFFKDNELYRIGIQFYNILGQTTQPFWIGDFKTPEGNLEGNYNTLKVELKQPALTNYINSLNLSENEKPVGYRILRVDRQANDRTIFCQGGLSGMIVQTTKDSSNGNFWIDGDALGFSENRREESLQKPKLPILTNRGFSDTDDFDTFPVRPYSHLRMLNQGGGETNDEIYGDNDSEFKTQNTWQYLKMMQMHSPDILFNTGLTFSENTKLRVLGGYIKEEVSRWGKVRNADSGNETQNDFEENTDNLIVGSDLGMYGPGNDDTDDRTVDVRFLYIYNKYSNFIKNKVLDYEVYGRPEITERGQNTTAYNGDSQFKYRNSLEDLLSDRYERQNQSVKNENAIVSANALGSRCVTIVEGANGIDEMERRSLKELYDNSEINNPDTILLAELIAPTYFLYLGNIYGGNTFEAKSRNTYLEIGDYSLIDNNVLQIDSPGDTFVQRFNFGRLLKADTERFAGDVHQLSEVLDFPVETSVNLLNRNDTSIFGWDNDFQPREDEYHNYNRVYSQKSNLIQSESQSFKLKKTNSFDSQIISSKLKVPGETIDSWTDFLENEIMNLDGKYGPINGMISHDDEIYTFQDKAISRISINPRVQVQGSDGIDIELGTGNILYDYNYLTTKSGSINKWGIYSTKKGIYYYDALNKSIGRIPDAFKAFLTDLKGLHGYFNNNFNYNLLKQDNPILNQGVLFGYDNYNNDVYFTFLQDDKSFTRCFNELKDEFVDLKTYLPNNYMNIGEKFLLSNTTNNALYEHYAGEYNNFFGEYQSSYITLMINPESNKDCVFNNLLFKSELYLDDIDQPKQTLTHIQAYNEYQDTGRIPLRISRNLNIRRKFREWKANIPRDGRDRIRNPWIFLKLELDNESNYKMILHDITVFYSTY